MIQLADVTYDVLLAIAWDGMDEVNDSLREGEGDRGKLGGGFGREAFAHDQGRLE